MKNKIFFCMLCMLGVLVMTSCKDKQEEPTHESEAQAPQIESKESAPRKITDYGNDELGQALMTYQKNGCWFKYEKPKLIENKGNRIDFYKPITDKDGKTWQFAQFARDFDFDGEYIGKQWPMMFIYEGEENLRMAIETFISNFQDTEEDNKFDSPRTLLSPEPTEIGDGVMIKDSHKVRNYINHSDYYEGKKVFMFGFNYSNKDIVFMFDLKK